MAYQFTQKQDDELNLAYQRSQEGRAMGEVKDTSGKITNYGDKANIDYAISKGWKPKTIDNNLIKQGMEVGDISQMLPSKTAADQAYRVYAQNTLSNAQNTADSLQKEIDSIRARQISEAQNQQKLANQQIDQYNQQIQPNIDAFSADLDLKRTALGKVYTQDYYDQLLTEKKSITQDIINYSRAIETDLNANANQPALARLYEGRRTNILEDYSAKLSVKNAALNAIDGNMSFAGDVLDQGINRLNGYYEQKVRFNELVNNVFKTDEVKRLTEETIKDIKTKQTELENTKNIILEMMSDPSTALVASKAGLSLTDNKDQIATKLNNFYAKNPGYQPDNIKVNQNLIAKYPDAGIALYDTPDIIRTKLSRSRLYQNDIAGGQIDIASSGYYVDSEGNVQQGSMANISNATADQIAEAIKQIESGGNYNAKGASGENGAYQFMPNTWASYSSEYARDVLQKSVKYLPMTPENQDTVAKFKIQQWLNQGLTPQQIAAKWNSGSEIGWENKIGVNSKGVSYNVPAYVNKVMNKLSKSVVGVVDQVSVSQGINKYAQQWAENIRDGKAKLSDITNEIEKNNPNIKNDVISIMSTLPPSKAQINETQKLLERLKELRNHPGLNSSVGPIGISRMALWDKLGNKD